MHSVDAQFFAFAFVLMVLTLAILGWRLGEGARTPRGQPHPVVGRAEQLGLRKVTKTHAEGVYQGVQVVILQTMLGWRIEAMLSGPLPGGLTLAPEAVASTLGARQDIQVGDAWLDYRLAIGGTDEEAAKTFLLTPEVSDRVRLLFRRHAIAVVKKDRVVTEREGEVDPSRLQGWLEFMVETVKILEGKLTAARPAIEPDRPALPFSPVADAFGAEGLGRLPDSFVDAARGGTVQEPTVDEVLGDLRNELLAAANDPEGS